MLDEIQELNSRWLHSEALLELPDFSLRCNELLLSHDSGSPVTSAAVVLCFQAAYFALTISECGGHVAESENDWQETNCSSPSVAYFFARTDGSGVGQRGSAISGRNGRTLLAHFLADSRRCAQKLAYQDRRSRSHTVPVAEALISGSAELQGCATRRAFLILAVYR